ncbi:MAG: hypothetical protein WDW38_007970 [Sanguina aurantia]
MLHILRGDTPQALQTLARSLPLLPQGSHASDPTAPPHQSHPSLTTSLPAWRQLLHLLTASAATSTATATRNSPPGCSDGEPQAGPEAGAGAELLRAVAALLLHTHSAHTSPAHATRASTLGDAAAPAAPSPLPSSHSCGMRHLAAPPHPLTAAAQQPAAQLQLQLQQQPQLTSGYASDLALGLDGSSGGGSCGGGDRRAPSVGAAAAAACRPVRHQRSAVFEHGHEVGASGGSGVGAGIADVAGPEPGPRQEGPPVEGHAAALDLEEALRGAYAAAARCLTPPSHVPAGPTVSLLRELLPGLPDMLVSGWCLFVFP